MFHQKKTKRAKNSFFSTKSPMDIKLYLVLGYQLEGDDYILKKFVFIIILFFTFTINGKASIFIVDDLGTKYPYEEKLISGNNAFLLGEEITDNVLLNNLAYISRFRNDLTFHATIQMLILKNTNPDREYYLSDGYNEIDTTNNVNLINSYLDSYNIIPEFAYQTLEVNYKAYLTLQDKDINFSNYNVSGGSIKVYGNSFDLSLPGAGLKIVTFTSNNINTLNNYIYANSIYYPDFEFYVNVLANIVNLNIITPENEDFSLKYATYDTNDNLIDEFTITNNNNQIYYEIGKNVYLKEISEYSIYELDENIYLPGNLGTKTIDINKEYKTFTVTIHSLLKNIAAEDDTKPTISNITVYDKNYNIIDNITCNEECTVKLKAGLYIFEEKLTKYKVKVEIYSDMDIEVIKYFINGLITTENIESISFNDNNITFTKKGNMFIFDTPLEADKYQVVVSGNKEVLDLTDYNNYVRIEELGIFYQYSLDEENKPTKPVEDIPIIESDDDAVTVLIPDTGLALLKGDYIIVKKKYYFNYFNNNYSYIC